MIRRIPVALTLVVGGLLADDIEGVFKNFEDGNGATEVDGKEQAGVNTNAKIKTVKQEILVTDVLRTEEFWKDATNGIVAIEKEGSDRRQPGQVKPFLLPKGTVWQHQRSR